MDRFGWQEYFSLLVPRENQDNRGKPDPYPLLYAMAILQGAGLPIQADLTVYIGDSVDDMAAAGAAGMLAIGFVPPYLDSDAHTLLLHEHGADLVTTDLESLPGKINSPNDWTSVES